MKEEEALADKGFHLVTGLNLRAPSPMCGELEDFKDSLKFIELLKEATLENSGLTKEQLTCLHNSVREKFIIDDPVVCLSIVLFTLENTLQECYNAIQLFIKRATGLLEVQNVMCVKSCTRLTLQRTRE
ncbi:hypothetical protein C8Q76DRAFT_698796 [Earliella scabrosa]|nr:hypothetical protein C8Q76DRAFT_698796 [Earliella scabrosa]